MRGRNVNQQCQREEGCFLSENSYFRILDVVMTLKYWEYWRVISSQRKSFGMFNLTTTSRQLLQKPSRLGAGLSAVLAPLSAACYSHWSSKTWMCWPASQDKNKLKKKIRIYCQCPYSGDRRKPFWVHLNFIFDTIVLLVSLILL